MGKLYTRVSIGVTIVIQVLVLVSVIALVLEVDVFDKWGLNELFSVFVYPEAVAILFYSILAH